MKRDYPTINVIETGRHLKCLMMDRGLTVRDIQVFLKLASPQGVYHWFEGKSMPSLDHIYALSELFQKPVDLLLIGNRRFKCIDSEDSGYRRLFMYYERLLVKRN